MNSRAGSSEFNTHPPVCVIEEPVQRKVIKRVDENVTSVHTESVVGSVELAPTNVTETVNMNSTTIQSKPDVDPSKLCTTVSASEKCDKFIAAKGNGFDVTYVTQTSYSSSFLDM